jgi:hypothetical protein
MWPAVVGAVLGNYLRYGRSGVFMIGTLPGVRSAPGVLAVTHSL